MRTALLVGLLLCGCRPEARQPGITLLIESPPDSLDGRLALSANGERLAQLIAPGLVTFDDASRPVPELAESFAWLDDRTLEFRLRPNLHFHDGGALTARDVQATFQALVSGEMPSTKREKYLAVRVVEAVDLLTVRFHLERAYAPLLSELGLGIVPERRARGPESALQDREPVGAGAFRFVRQVDEEHLELAAFDGYYGGPPKIRELHVRVVRDETTRMLELLKGRADLTLNTLSPAVLPELGGQHGLRVATAPGSGFAYLGFNVRSGPLSDARVRHALCHLIDLAPIVQYKFHDLARTATGMLAQTHWAYGRTDGCQYDPAEAARLLREAGFPQLTLSFKTSTDRFRKSVALVLKEQLERGGIAVDLRALEFGTLFNDVRKGNFELVVLKWSTTFEPDLMRQVFSSTQMPSEANHFAGLNRGGYANPELDKILDRAAAAAPDERAPLYRQALALLDRDLPYAPLWHEDTVAVVSEHLPDFRPSALGFWNGLATASVAP